MARPLVIGNGRLLVQFDETSVMRDLFYPRVGQVNQIKGRQNQLGVWAEERFAWLSDPGWKRRQGYRTGTLVAETEAVHEDMCLRLTISEAVHPQMDVLIRRMRLQDLSGRERTIRVFSAHDFDLDETDIGDTAMWDPVEGALIHYKRSRWMLMSARGPIGGVFQYATGRKRFQGSEGTWRDAEDGWLEGHPISQGSVDCTFSVEVPLEAGATADAFFWILCGHDHPSVKAGNTQVKLESPERMLAQAEGYWRGWLQPHGAVRRQLPADLQEAYDRSLMIVRTQADEGGAILAANDTDILEHNRDHYSYMWPRDGALVAAALDRAGYGAVTRRFFHYCRKALGGSTFFWHKYNPDGTPGSSWHPWLGSKGYQLPIQEDETALVLWALGVHVDVHGDREFAGELFPGLVRPTADFLVSYRDPETGLPLASYDLWEERRGIFTFTTAAVVAGLREASSLAILAGDAMRAARYAEAADGVRTALLKHLWSDEHQCFLRGLYVKKDGGLTPDPTPDSSIFALLLLDVLDPDDPRMEATARRLAETLTVKTPIGGMARYYDDYYFRVGNDPTVIPGNPWIICTLWLARWHIARARRREDLLKAEDLIRWSLRHAMPTGILPEQVHPLHGGPLSVAPLTWSHATMFETLLLLAEKKEQL